MLENPIPRELHTGNYDFVHVDIYQNQNQAMILPGMGGNTEHTMPYPGCVVAISVASNGARTAGSCQFNPRINGAAGPLTAILDGTMPQYAYATQGPGRQTFNAGDRLTCQVISDAAWLPNGTPDVQVTVTVAFATQIPRYN